jgi:hypothetical protein
VRAGSQPVETVYLPQAVCCIYHKPRRFDESSSEEDSSDSDSGSDGGAKPTNYRRRWRHHRHEHDHDHGEDCGSTQRDTRESNGNTSSASSTVHESDPTPEPNAYERGPSTSKGKMKAGVDHGIWSIPLNNGVELIVRFLSSRLIWILSVCRTCTLISRDNSLAECCIFTNYHTFQRGLLDMSNHPFLQVCHKLGGKNQCSLIYVCSVTFLFSLRSFVVYSLTCTDRL